MSKGVYAGSFDPPTLGHLWMIREGAKQFGWLTVSIGDNPAKKYQFTTAERVAMLKEMTKDLSNVNIKVFVGDFLINHAKDIGATCILRGIRNETDYEFERGMRYINAEIDDSISTTYLIPPRELIEVSSSLVKSLVGPAGWRKVIKPYVSESVYSAILMRDLRQKFDLAMAFFKIKNTEPLFQEVVLRYSEPHRHYHTLEHIADCLDQLMRFSFSPEATKLLTEPQMGFNRIVLSLAIWFHDFIYDTKASDNEEQSAQKFKDLILAATSDSEQVGMDDVIAHTSKLILATKTHEGTHPLTHLMLDIDLSILGRSPEEFKEYDANIRKEYSWVLGPLYSMNRKKFMKRYYEKDRLFHTDFFHDKFERQAKENLKSIL